MQDYCMMLIRSLALLLVAALAAMPALAQDRRVPASAAELRLSYAAIVQRVQPAVVNVYAAKMVQNRNPLMDDPIFRRFFGVPGQQPEQMQRSLGSGVLVDMTGRLAGINTAIYSRSGGSQGIGFAIPANMVRVVVASAKSGGKAVKRPWLGARLQAVTPEIAESLGLRLPSGALVASVLPNSPAARAGLKPSDLVVAIDGQAIDDPNAFDYRFATRP